MAKEDLFGDEGDMVRMTFGEHLEDLRRRLILALLGFLPGVVIGLFIGGWLVDEITRPVKAALIEFYDARRATKLSDLAKKRAAGKEIRKEKLRLVLSREAFRDAVRQAYPEMQFPEDTPDPAGDAAHKNDPGSDNSNGPEATHPGNRQPDRPPPAEKRSIEVIAEVDHDELEVAAEPKFYPGAGMITLGPQESFMAYMKVSIVAGLVLSSWWVIYQLWQFVAEGLYKNERKVVYRAMPLSAGLFFVGVGFCFFVVLPVVLAFFFSFNKWLSIEPNIRLSEWLGFATMLPVIFGICFELPLVMLVLEQVGIFKLEDYTSRWRHAILIISIVAMVVTPTTDPGSMMLLMGPMTALYGLGLAMVRLRHGGLASLGGIARLRVIVASLATIYAVGISAGLWLPDSWIGREWWYEEVWKLGTLPASYLLKSQYTLKDTNWLGGVTVLNAAVFGLVILRLGEILMRLTRRAGGKS